MKIEQTNDLPNAEFEISIVGTINTVHRVFLSQDYYQQLTGGYIEPKELIQRSFDFLLEKEPNTSILSEFNLKKIQEYFPEYEESIKSTVEMVSDDQG